LGSTWEYRVHADPAAARLPYRWPNEPIARLFFPRFRKTSDKKRHAATFCNVFYLSRDNPRQF
jgi:hypothetical protein